ncbi:MFS transporter [Streptomyces violaceus]
MPLAVFVLGFGVFCMNTTEVMVAGLLPALSRDLDVSIPMAGNLVSVFALGMVIGGPLLTIALLRAPRKASLVSLLALFIVGQAIGALATDYWVMIIARLVTALATGAFFGLAASVCVNLVPAEKLGRAIAVVFGGLMIAQVLGLPASTLIDQHLGWRASFWAVDIVAAVSLLAVLAFVPHTPQSEGLDVRSELRGLRNGRLWGAYTTNALLIGAVFATFAYLSPVLTDLSGFSAGVVPLLFLVYGIGTILGNWAIGRLADKHTMGVLWIGGTVLMLVLAAYSLVGGNQVGSVIALMLLGLVGLPLNPAMAARVMKASNSGPLVNTLNTATINVGIVIGPALAGLGISVSGYRAPMWTGALLALGALFTLLIAQLADRRDVRVATAPSAGSEPVKAGV